MSKNNYENKYDEEALSNEIGKEYTAHKQKSKLVEKNIESKAEKKESLENYYDLKTESVDKLVNASIENVSEIEDKKYNPYKINRLSRIPVWIKACFGKWWFAAAICFFFYWGLGTAITNFENLLLVLAVALGLTTDLILYNIFRYAQTDAQEYAAWMFLPQRKLWTFFVNTIYCALLTYLVSWIYQGINLFAITVGWVTEDNVFLGVEPILFGLFYLGVDCFFLLWKNLIIKAVKRKKAENQP